MAKAYNRAKTREFIPSCDRNSPASEQTKFKLGPLSIFDFTAMEEEILKHPEAPQTFGKLFLIVRYALRGWENFTFDDGTEAKFELGPDGIATIECVKLIAPRELVEMAHDCNSQENLTTEEVGK